MRPAWGNADTNATLATRDLDGKVTHDLQLGFKVRRQTHRTLEHHYARPCHMMSGSRANSFTFDTSAYSLETFCQASEFGFLNGRCHPFEAAVGRGDATGTGTRTLRNTSLTTVWRGRHELLDDDMVASNNAKRGRLNARANRSDIRLDLSVEAVRLSFWNVPESTFFGYNPYADATLRLRHRLTLRLQKSLSGTLKVTNFSTGTALY